MSYIVKPTIKSNTVNEDDNLNKLKNNYKDLQEENKKLEKENENLKMQNEKLKSEKNNEASSTKASKNKEV